MKAQILMASRSYLTANKDFMMLNGTEGEIREELETRYAATYSALKVFTLVQILPGRNVDVKWSSIGGSERNLLALMAEQYVISVLGKECCLPLYGFYKSWGTTSMLSTCVRNTTGKKYKNNVS
jgi:hypothetical protein